MKMATEEDADERKDANVMEENLAVNDQPTEMTEPDSSNPPGELRITIHLSRLSVTEQAIYQCLRSQGWTDAQCGLYFNEIDGMQDALHHRFTEEGWPASLLQVFHDCCRIELPHTLPPPTKQDGSYAGVESLEMTFKLLEEMTRRKEIGEKLYEAWKLSR